MVYVSRHSLGATATDPLAAVRAGSAVLKRGSKGDAVRALQQILRDGQIMDNASDPLVVDGDFGPATERVVKQLQTVNGLTSDGIVGKQTMQVLDVLKDAVAATAAAASAGSASASTASTSVKRVPVKATSRADALRQAKDKAKGQAEAKAKALRDRGIADAKAGKYAAPAPTAPPDFDTMTYQAGWLSTGTPLPAGVVQIGPGGVPVTQPASGGESGAAGGGLGGNTTLIVGGAVAAALVLLLVLRRRSAA